MASNKEHVYNNSWETDPKYSAYPIHLLDFISEIVHPLGLELYELERTVENREYGGVSLTINGRKILFRVAKTTPLKDGQFVALYKRSPVDGKIVPISINDEYDYVFIATYNQYERGMFIIGKEVLLQKGIFSTSTKVGKLAFRIYPTWVETKNYQAVKTQKWQSQHFLTLTSAGFLKQSKSTQKSFGKNSQEGEVLVRFKKLFL